MAEYSTTIDGGREARDLFSLKLKAEYVLTERSHALPQITHVAPVPSTSDTKDGDRNFNNKEKNKSRSQKRPRDERPDVSSKICLAVLREEVCPYGEKCRFIHDMKVFMASRPEDIKEIDKCPIFASKGHCPYGAVCRLGKSHINSTTGRNIIETKEIKIPEVMNALSKDVQNQLRKKTYPFACKRHFQTTENMEKIKNDSKSQDEVKEGDRKENDTVIPTELTAIGDDSIDVSVVDIPKSASLDCESKDYTKLAEQEGILGVVDSSKTYIKILSRNSATTSTATPKLIDMSPLPSRTRKIIDFSNKIYVAPLTTVGNLPFRRIMKKFGADITCGEMALAQNILEGKPGEWALLKRHPEEDIFGVQIAAGFPDMFTRTMELIEKETTVDFVDLNLGCPLDLVCDKGSGASLMLRDKKFKECLMGITKTLTCPVTIKMRTGWDEKKPVAHSLVPKIQSWELPGVSAIMIHGRSRLQRYSKEADWDYISQVAKSQDPSLGNLIPVIGNGDILNYTDYEAKALSRDGLSSCAMLARGALIKPWLPTEIKERRHWDISASERLDILKDFVRFGLENWGSDQQGVNNCRRFLLEWLSFLHRYVPIGILEQSQPQQMNHRPPTFMCGRSDLETLFLSNQSCDWIKISEMLLGPVPEGFQFAPKHKANSYS